MIRISRAAAALALLAAGVLACTDVTAPMEDPAAVTFAPALNVNLAGMQKTASGLYIQDLIVGGGRTVEAKDSIVVRYSGWLARGYKFDSTGTDRTFSLVLGRNAVISGWEEGLLGAKVGGRRRLVIPPALGYGDRSVGTIPAGSVLIFDVDVVNAVKIDTTSAGGQS